MGKHFTNDSLCNVPLAKAVQSAGNLLVEAEHVVALVGSGLSVDSGIPTFRGTGGIGSRLGAPSSRGYKLFLENPEAWWKQQVDRNADPARTLLRDAIDKAQPNAGHIALAKLEKMGVLKLTVTQNVDGLHQKAGSSLVAEIHGNRAKLRCIGCESRWHNYDFGSIPYPSRCSQCGDLVKTDTVMFGEPVPSGTLSRCYREANRCDCIIAAGTSGTVFPAANIPDRVVADGGSMIEANITATPLSSRANVILRGSTSHTLPLIVERVQQLTGISTT